LAVVLRRLALGPWLRAYADSLPRGLVRRQFIADGRWFATRWLQNLDCYRLLLMPQQGHGTGTQLLMGTERRRLNRWDGMRDTGVSVSASVSARVGESVLIPLFHPLEFDHRCTCP